MKTLIALLIMVVWSFSTSAQDATKAYSNYDFIPGEKIIFEDDFRDSQDGEFPPRWNLVAQQGVVNKVGGDSYFVFLESSLGSMGKISPRIKMENYLPSSFTVEVDFFIGVEEDVAIFFKDNEGDDGRFISADGNGSVGANYFANEVKGHIPDEGVLHGQWHHLALAYKNHQMKVYIDQHRVVVIPDCGFEPVSLCFGGSLDVRIKNAKIAEGGGMNMLDKILTDGKFISHAVNFNSGKSEIKGESMGFLNELAKWLNTNSQVNIEIGGHTDSDGDEASNLKLSQLRAEAVKSYLVSRGVSSARLTTKGYGETKSIDNNATPEGKANNRRVEFVKIS